MHGNPTLEQNGPSCDSLTGAIGPGMGCLGPIEAMILWAACPITLQLFQRGPIYPWSAKMHGNLTLEQNGPSQDALRATVGLWMGCLGTREAKILWAA